MSTSKENGTVPNQITLDENAGSLSLSYSEGRECKFTCEFLRVFSPSAEVVGHGPGQRVNPIGKENIRIVEVEPVGNYAIKIVFSDGHDTGIYSWKYFQWLAANKKDLWARYTEETSVEAGAIDDKSHPNRGNKTNKESK
mgnify:FL=1